MSRPLRFTDPARYDKRRGTWVGRLGALTVAKSSMAQPSPKNNALATPELAAEMLAAAARILASVDEHVQAVAKPLAVHHAERWQKDGESSPSAAALAKQLKLERLEIGHDGEHWLEFAALASFASHRPSLWVKNDTIVDARLERPVAKNGHGIGGFDMHKLILPIGHHAPKPSPEPGARGRTRSRQRRWRRPRRSDGLRR